MKLRFFLLIFSLAGLPLAAEIQRQERKSMLDADPEVVYLEKILKKPIELKVLKEATVFSDKDGQHRLGTLKANQTVRLEAITDKIYQIRGQGTRDGIAGWVAPWAFSATDPEFVAHLKSLYERQIQVQTLIAARSVAVGMTVDEVVLSLGNPTKTATRKADGAETGRWEFIEYEQVKHYVTRIDPVSGIAFRQLSHITQEEKNKTAVEFVNQLVTAVEESKDSRGGAVKIIIPQLMFHW
jgi:hypothetical protein